MPAAGTRARRHSDAEEPLVRAGEMAPRDPRSFYRLGLVRQQLGKNGEARQAFEQFIVLAPSRMATAVADARARISALR